MFKLRLATVIRSLILVFFAGMIGEVATSSDAFARAGGRRSFGRQAPSPQRSAPPPSNYNAPQAQPQRGSFMRGLAGGVAGGFLGSMLFGSMGHAAGLGGAGRGGIGLLEIILLAGLAYLGYRWWKNRQLQTAAAGPGGGFGNFSRDYSSPAQSSAQPMVDSGGAFARSLGNSPQTLDSETASDIFFKVQGAWTRRDLSPLQGLLGAEVARTLQDDLSELKQAQRINRLENISIRRIDVLENWQDHENSLARVRIEASLLDYTVDERSSQVLEGSDSQPVKFEEEWLFARPLSGQSPWQLVGIQQV